MPRFSVVTGSRVRPEGGVTRRRHTKKVASGLCIGSGAFCLNGRPRARVPRPRWPGDRNRHRGPRPDCPAALPSAQDKGRGNRAGAAQRPRERRNHL